MAPAVSLKGGVTMTATISSSASIYMIDCPLFCGGESSLVIDGYDKPVIVSPCAACAAQGGTAWEVTVSQAEHYMRPAVNTVLQHRDGLVAFR